MLESTRRVSKEEEEAGVDEVAGVAKEDGMDEASLDAKVAGRAVEDGKDKGTEADGGSGQASQRASGVQLCETSPGGSREET